ncbi:hypothetical protein Hanom_Chr13g01229131 [Helianthus anomalus]
MNVCLCSFAFLFVHYLNLTKKSHSLSVHEQFVNTKHIYFLNEQTRTRPCLCLFGSFAALPTTHLTRYQPDPSAPLNKIDFNTCASITRASLTFSLVNGPCNGAEAAVGVSDAGGVGGGNG